MVSEPKEPSRAAHKSRIQSVHLNEVAVAVSAAHGKQQRQTLSLLLTEQLGKRFDVTYMLSRDMGEVENMFRLAAFNVLAHDRDDHSKNIYS